MKRRHLFEFEDQPWFPQLLREYMTDYLFFITSLNSWLFRNFAVILKHALARQKEQRILDLCSGGAGPLPKITTMLKQNDYPVTVVLSDMYPNIEAFTRVKTRYPDFDFVTSPVDATQVPSSLTGFRTILNGFHHFPPDQARQILVDAASKRQGIAIMELVSKTPFSFVAVLLTPLFLVLLTPFMRPFRISRLVLTYMVPLIPLFTLWDGIVSCLRVYSVDELRSLVADIDDKEYTFDIGIIPLRGTTGVITFLFGTVQETRIIE